MLLHYQEDPRLLVELEQGIPTYIPGLKFLKEQGRIETKYPVSEAGIFYCRLIFVDQDNVDTTLEVTIHERIWPRENQLGGKDQGQFNYPENFLRGYKYSFAVNHAHGGKRIHILPPSYEGLRQASGFRDVSTEKFRFESDWMAMQAEDMAIIEICSNIFSQLYIGFSLERENILQRELVVAA